MWTLRYIHLCGRSIVQSRHTVILLALLLRFIGECTGISDKKYNFIFILLLKRFFLNCLWIKNCCFFSFQKQDPFLYDFDFGHCIGLEVPGTISRNSLHLNSWFKDRRSLMHKIVLSFRKILHVWSRFRTDKAKEDYCYRGKLGGGRNYNQKKNIKKMNWTLKYSELSDLET